MYIEFLQVRAKNFMSIGSTPVELTLNEYAKSLIIGKNGNGKSVIIEAIIFALYGKPYRKINKSALINSINGKQCETEIEFKINDKHYKIIRTIKPDTFKIYENDILLDQDAATKDYQSYLENTILKMDYKTCVQMVIIGAMGYTPFLQLKAAERRTFIESILDLQLFSNMNKNLKSIQSEEKTKYTTSQNNMNVYKSKIETYINVIKDLESNNDKKIQEIDDKIKSKMIEYKESLVQATNSQTEYDKFGVFEDTSQKIQTIINTSNTNISVATTSNNNLNKRIKFFDTTSECQVCEQSIDPSHKQSHIDAMNIDITLNSKIIVDNNEILVKCNAKLVEVNKQKQLKVKLEQNLAKDNDTSAWIKKDVVRLGKEKQSLETSDDSTLNNSKTQLDNTITLLNNEDNISIESFAKLQVYDTMLLSLKDTGAKAQIIKQYIPIINQTVNKYLDKLGLYIKFELDENFNETLKSRQRDDFTYESFSNGERFRIDASLLFAWREITKVRTGVESSLLFMDELMEVVDDQGFSDVLSIIDSISNLHCFIISHKQNLDMMFDNIVEIKKVKEFTVIE